MYYYRPSFYGPVFIVPVQQMPVVNDMDTSLVNSGATNIAGIINIKWNSTKNQSLIVNANVLNLIDIGSFILDTVNPAITFRHAGPIAFEITVGVDYVHKEFYISGFVNVPFEGPVGFDRLIIFTW